MAKRTQKSPRSSKPTRVERKTTPKKDKKGQGSERRPTPSPRAGGNHSTVPGGLRHVPCDDTGDGLPLPGWPIQYQLHFSEPGGPADARSSKDAGTGDEHPPVESRVEPFGVHDGGCTGHVVQRSLGSDAYGRFLRHPGPVDPAAGPHPS